MAELVPNILASISGKPKSGKTHLACTFPAPIKIYSLDLGAAFVASKFKDKQIDIKEYQLPIVEDDKGGWAFPIWNELKEDYKADVESGVYKTLVLDTATVVWQICHQAISEHKPKELAFHAPNLAMSSLFARARVAGINLVTTQYLREHYVGGNSTGELELDGWRRTEGNVDIILEMESKTMGEGSGAKTVMITKIKECRFDRDLNGKTFQDTDYDEIMALLGV